MNETREQTTVLRRVLLPLLIAAAVVVGTVIISGSALIRIEDVTVNRILAGTYGTPDWRVQGMNPLLAQVLTLFYTLIPSVNWYGGMLLLLLLIAGAAGIGLAGRRVGGLIPAAIAVSPLLLLLTNSMLSTAVCAICAAVGTLLLLDGLRNRKVGAARVLLGAVLFLFAMMLSMWYALVLAAMAAVCWLPCSLRESRIRGWLIGVPVIAVIAFAMYGYSELMYNTPELSVYRNNYGLYESLQHSSLRDESERLLSKYGIMVSDEDHSDHDHAEEEADAQEAEAPAEVEANAFDVVGWTINDASLFFSRYGSDTGLTDPDVLRTLSGEAKFIDFTASRLAGELFTTVKKPQFLLLIAIFALSALAVVATSRRRGLIALFAAVFAFGGHVVTLAMYYNSFADIAPYYLLAIFVMLYHFDGNSAVAWYRRALQKRSLRVGVSCFAVFCFAVGMAGLFYFTRANPANPNVYTVEAVDFIKPYVAEHKDMLFIGDNPNDRFKPQTLAVPVRGDDENLLAGTYDLYSPRAAALMAKYDMDNPLTASIGREDVGYIVMSFNEAVTLRAASAYGIYLKNPDLLLAYPEYSEQIVSLIAFTQEEMDEIIEEERKRVEAEALMVEMILDMDARGLLLDAEEEQADEAEADQAGEEVAPAQEPSPSAAVATPEATVPPAGN